MRDSFCWRERADPDARYSIITADVAAAVSC